MYHTVENKKQCDNRKRLGEEKDGPTEQLVSFPELSVKLLKLLPQDFVEEFSGFKTPKTVLCVDLRNDH